MDIKQSNKDQIMIIFWSISSFFLDFFGEIDFCIRKCHRLLHYTQFLLLFCILHNRKSRIKESTSYKITDIAWSLDIIPKN